MTNPHDLSTPSGRKVARDAVARSNLSAELKTALIGALDAGGFLPSTTKPKGRPPDPDWKKQQKAWRGMLIDRAAPREQQAEELRRLAAENNISVDAMRDRLSRPGRKRKKA